MILKVMAHHVSVSNLIVALIIVLVNENLAILFTQLPEGLLRSNACFAITFHMFMINVQFKCLVFMFLINSQEGSCCQASVQAHSWSILSNSKYFMCLPRTSRLPFYILN